MMKKHGPDFYDDKKVFETYTKHRLQSNTPNETIEQPILWDLIGNPRDLAVLDLGCGAAESSKKFKNLGARRYLGIEGSEKMFQLAKENMETDFSEVQHSWLENLDPPHETFDLVISSLVFHYIDNLEVLFNKIHRTLKPGGQLIFSVEHPVLTSCNKSLENSPLRQAWIVDNYFERGARNVQWMGDTVIKYHRTIEDFLNILENSKFNLKKLRESDPPRKCFDDEELWQRRRRIPLFLIIKAQRP
jgi:SAM-dependent methyltransferase